MSTQTNERTGFMAGTPYAGAARDIEAQEAELAALEAEHEANIALNDDVEDPGIQAIDAEEASWKKRYGDLRRHADKKARELKEELEQLRNEVRIATPPQVPEDDEEYERWANEYPEAAKMISTVARKESLKATKALETELETLKERERRLARQEAELELSKLHPDWQDIKSDDDFHAWVAEQPEAIQDLLYKSDTDYKGVARFLDLYKADKGRRTPDKKPRQRADIDAADLSTRRTPPSAPTPGNAKVWKESVVAKMSPREYAANEAEIDKAMSEGNFVFDLRR